GKVLVERGRGGRGRRRRVGRWMWGLEGMLEWEEVGAREEREGKELEGWKSVKGGVGVKGEVEGVRDVGVEVGDDVE
ncbi:hypothetical protein, partial [Prescottella equi]|uniref:hypothetical protein n=1 Tax=Rhodococcus hoagii TaxID=43767 RepID=UPI0016426D90